MTSLRILTIRSVAELRRRALAWDDLWLRSPVSTPRARAALIAAWIEQFARRASFRAVVVERDGRFLAALPLVTRRVKRALPVVALPGNDWATCGELLVDLTAADAADAVRCLASALSRGRWPMFWLDFVPTERADWTCLLESLAEQGLSIVTRPQFAVGVVDRQADFASYEQRYARRFRRNRRRNAKLLTASGGAAFRMFDRLAPAEARRVMELGFAVEDRSWKGAEGTSVLKNPRPLEFYLREAEQLAEWGGLELAFLDHAGESIAFQYVVRGKGVHYLAKCGYDASCSRFGPGVQLMSRTIEWLHDQPESLQIDFCGPLTSWTEEFITGKYPVSRVVMARGQGLQHALLRFYDGWAPRIKKFVQGLRGAPAPAPVEAAGQEADVDVTTVGPAATAPQSAGVATPAIETTSAGKSHG